MPPSGSQKATLHYILFFLCLLVYSIVYYNETITKLPYGIHDWAQADRFSLARNFYDNGMNFFKPATNNLFSRDGVTGVEFPIQAYIAACLGFIFGREHIQTCFRALDIFIIWVGLFFLFRIVYSRTRDFIFSIVAPLFIFCSPVFIFYGGSFLPDPAGVAVSFVAFYFLRKHFDSGKRKDLVMAIAWFTLAALIKTTIALYLIVTLAYLFFSAIAKRNRQNIINVLILGFLSGGVLLGWFLYTGYLNKTYDSTLFLASAAPFINGGEFTAYIEHWFKHKWMAEYMILPQYLFIAMAAVPAIYLLRRQRQTPVLSLIGLFFVTFIAAMYLMGHQLEIHDYYIIAMFFPFAGWLLSSSMLAVHRELSERVAVKSLRLSLFTAVLMMFFFADHHNHKRIQTVYPAMNYVNDKLWMYGGDKILDSLGIARDEKIAALSADAPNLALVLFDRKGIHIPHSVWGHGLDNVLPLMRERGIKILVVEDPVAEGYVQENPHYFDDFTTLARSDNKRVLRLNN